MSVHASSPFILKKIRFPSSLQTQNQMIFQRQDTEDASPYCTGKVCKMLGLWERVEVNVNELLISKEQLEDKPQAVYRWTHVHTAINRINLSLDLLNLGTLSLILGKFFCPFNRLIYQDLYLSLGQSVLLIILPSKLHTTF